MTTTIVMAGDHDHLLASPTSGVDINTLVGKEAIYVDGKEKRWMGRVESIEDGTFLVLKFDDMPPGLAQGQIVEVLDGVD